MSLETATAAADERRESGPHAFPTAFNGEHEGMTLRDWFAGQALNALAEGAGSAAVEGRVHDVLPLIAKISYAVADAMLRERFRR